MKAMLSAVAGILLTAMTGHAELKISDIKACYGPLGLERKSLEIQQFDELHFRFKVIGLELDKEGNVDAELRMTLKDPKDKTVFDEMLPLKDFLPLGGETTANSHLTFGGKLEIGNYVYTLTVTDKIAKKDASFEKTLASKPAHFAILAPELSHDPDKKVPASTSWLAGERLFFNLRVVGMDKSQDKMEVEMAVEIFDDKGKATLAKPILTSVKSEDADRIKKINFVTLNGHLALHRAGKFTLSLKVTDKITKKTEKFEIPLTVSDP